ncbi:MAG: two-component regulator propeller domain-containing protein [Bacteroidota bacterium]
MVLLAQDTPVFSNIQYFTSDEGLSQSEVTAILQDRRGFLWIGTRGGLNRFDGYTFKVFQNEIGNANSLANNSIESLIEDHLGNIWIGTKSNGLSYYQPEYDRFEHFSVDHPDSSRLSGNRIISLIESEAGEIWMGTWENGLTILDPQSKRTRHLFAGVTIQMITQSQDGHIWIASPNGLYKLSGEGVLLDHYYNHQRFTSVLEDPLSQQLFLGTWGAGLFQFDREKEELRAIATDYPHKKEGRPINMHFIHTDRQKRIWIGSWGGGWNLYQRDTGRLIRYDLHDENKDGDRELYRDVLCVHQDRSGIFWVGTNGGGLCKLDERIKQFGLKRNASGMAGFPREPIWSVLKDQDEVLWVGTKGGEDVHYSQDGQPFQRLSLPLPPGSKPGAKVIYEDHYENLWLTTKHSLYRIEKNAETYAFHQQSIIEEKQSTPIRQSHISAFLQTSDGTYWFGRQLDGLRKSIDTGPLSQRTFKVYEQGEEAGSLQHYRVSCLLEDQEKRLWVGTYGGLHLYQEETDSFLHYPKKQGDVSSLSSDIIICMYEDRRKRLWVGTPNGLNLAIPLGGDSLAFRCFQEQDGLPNNYIHGILEDDKGNLWVSTNKGISTFNPDKGIFLNYDVNDGLQSNSFMENVAYRDKEGIFYFGGIRGLNFFHPDSIVNHSVAPPILLTGLKVFNQEVRVGMPFNDRIILDKSIEYSQEIHLSHRENVFSIEYTALDFYAPFGNTYVYMMDGLEEEWNTVGGQRSVTYTNLKPQKYTFRVKAVNSKGVWSESEARLAIEILPPFWASWQAFILYGMLIMGLLLLYRHIISLQNGLKNKLEIARLEREKEMEMAEMKTRFFTNITHELRSPLTLITGPLEQLKEEEELGGRLKEMVASIHRNGQRLLGLVNQLLDFRKAESGNMSLQAAEGNFRNFAHEVYLSFRMLAEHQQITFRFEHSDQEIPLYYDRDKMEIVLCNLLSNAFKYTSTGQQIDFCVRQVSQSPDSLKAQFPQGFCEILVRDNGLGMGGEVVEKIFDRFYQIANTDTVKLVGTGIGLSLAKTLVELHKGSIEAESQLGEGSTFTVHLPLGNAHLSQADMIDGFKNSEHTSHYHKPIAREMARGGRTDMPRSILPPLAKLLIVEDNPEIRIFIRNIFEKLYEVAEAENGEEGLEMVDTWVPDLIISDLMMPKMDGLAFCKQIKEGESTAHIPVILLTARTSTVFQVKGYDSGADAYITKPFQPVVLKAQVNGLLAGREKLKSFFTQTIRLKAVENSSLSPDQQFLSDVIKLVEDNLMNEAFSRDFLAKSLAMSPSTFYRKIKALTGYTSSAFIRSIRLKKAAETMQSTSYNISEIAFMVGFNDLKYFRTSFREQFGMNPSEYLQKNAPTPGRSVS